MTPALSLAPAFLRRIMIRPALVRSPLVRAAALPLAAAMTLTACQSSPDPQISDVWMRLAPVADRPAAAYFNLRGGSENDRLIMVSTDVAQRTELHESANSGGKMAMRAMPGGVDVPAHGEVKFAPGGMHVMVFGLSPSVKAGQRIRMFFTFASGRKYAAKAIVRAPDSSGS